MHRVVVIIATIFRITSINEKLTNKVPQEVPRARVGLLRQRAPPGVKSLSVDNSFFQDDVQHLVPSLQEEYAKLAGPLKCSNPSVSRQQVAAKQKSIPDAGEARIYYLLEFKRMALRSERTFGG